MLEANPGKSSRLRGRMGGDVFFFWGVQNHFELFFSPIELVFPAFCGGAIDFTEINSSPGEISPAFWARHSIGPGDDG